MNERPMHPSDLPFSSRVILGLMDERGTSIPLGLRIILAIAAIGLIFERAPWADTRPLIIMANLAFPVFMATLAVTGAAPGRSRMMCYLVGVAYVLLIAAKALYLLSA